MYIYMICPYICISVFVSRCFATKLGIGKQERKISCLLNWAKRNECFVREREGGREGENQRVLSFVSKIERDEVSETGRERRCSDLFPKSFRADHI
jgi:hypothetical protein